MPEKQLPVRPSLEQYKKQARELLRACRNGNPDALARLHAHHSRSKSIATVKLADAQFVLAREHDFENWPRFAAHIEQLRMAASVAALENPADAFLRAALPLHDWHASGTLNEANAILARYPHVARASLFTAAVLADEAAVRAVLTQDPAAVRATGGPEGWDALCHLCFSRYLRLDPTRSDAFVATARALLDAGANPNTGWFEKPDHEGGAPVWESAIYGAAGLAHHPGLTRLPLERGADPNDGETPYHAPESYDNAVLRILLESDRLSAQSKRWVLVRKADWHDLEGIRLALDHGADPNAIPHWGNNAPQHAVQRDNRIEILRLLLERGADPHLPNGRDGRTAVQMAARRVRGDFLAILAERSIDLRVHGCDALVAACAQSDRSRIDDLIAAEPALREALLAEGADLLGAFAGVGNTGGVRCLLELGVPPDALYSGDPYFDTAKDSTALHAAAWRGHPDTVQPLLDRGAPLDARDGKGRTALQLAVRACTDSYWKDRRSPAWVEPLLKAGASTEGIPIPTGYPAADDLLRRYEPQSH